MRFFDYLLQWGFELERELGETIIFDASEIAAELDKVQRKAGESYPREIFGVCSPPFVERPFWIEANTTMNALDYASPGDLEEMEKFGMNPEDVLKNAKLLEGQSVYRGVLCLAHDVDSEPVQAYLKEGYETFPQGDPRWMIVFHGFSCTYDKEPRKEMLLPILARAFVIIGRDGTLLSDPDNVRIEALGGESEEALLFARAIANMIPFTLLSLSFLHRRTEIELISPNRLERKNAARAMGQKRRALPLRDYYMVRVKPHNEAGGPLTNPSQIRPLHNPRGGERRSHSVRGHFRRVPDSGLFGRGYQAGELLWIPDHIRGEGSLGSVQKSYKISKE